MAQFVIEKLKPGDTAPPNVQGQRALITLPECPANLETWNDLVNWWAKTPDIPFAFHLAVMALMRTFHEPPKPR